MSGDAHPPSGGGGGDNGGSGKMSPVAIVIIILVLVFSGVFTLLTSQIGGFLQMLRYNAGPILLVLGALAIFGAFKKK